MPDRKHLVRPGEPTPATPPTGEPPPRTPNQDEPASYAGPWDVDPHWSDDQEDIDEMADAERIAPAAAILGWTDLEPIDLDALFGPATSPELYGYSDNSDVSDLSEDVDDAGDQL